MHFVVNHNDREEMSGAAILLFGKNPQRFFKRARVRFIRYDGTEAKVGTEMNVIKDEMFEGCILDMVRNSLDFVRSQIKEHTKLGADGLFHTTPEYPEFAWKEIIINAVAHKLWKAFHKRCYAKLIVMQSQFRNPFKTGGFGTFNFA